MTVTSFNADWTVKRRVSAFSEMSGAVAPATPVTLPHDAMISLTRTADAAAPSGFFPSGEFEYEKSFEVPDDYRSKRVSLQFQGVYRDAMVYVNGAFAAQRPSGYATFTVPLDGYLKYGQTNTVKVEAREHLDSRWYSGAGIHRDTALVVTELVHVDVDGLRITTPDVDDERAVVEAAVAVRNQSIATCSVRVTAEVSDDSGVVVASGTSVVTVRAGGRGITRLRMFVREPRLWSAESPELYTAKVAVLEDGEHLDEQSTTFGIRTIRLDPFHGLRINGQEVKLRGACIHHDNGILGAATIARAEERRIEILKEAGFNAIRSSHNPLSQAMLDACDRLGMIVMDETFDMWTESKTPYDYALSFPEWWERDVEAFVAKNHNHPSVVFYSIGNEIPETGSPLGSEWGRRLAEKVRELDPTRLVTNGINGFVSVLPQFMAMAAAHGGDENGGGVNTFMNAAGEMMNQITASELVTHATEESFSVLDVAGLNYGDGRYLLDRDLFPNRVVVGTETFPTRIAVNWRLVEENPHVIGDFTWTGWDYLGEAGIGRTVYTDREALSLSGSFPTLVAGCGDIDIIGHRRPASYYRETVFGLRHEPYIAVIRPEFHGEPRHEGMWTWSDAVSTWTWGVPAGSPTTVEVYSDAEEVELLINGRSIGRAPAGPDHEFRASFETVYEPGEIVAVAFAGGAELARTALRTAEGDVRLVVAPDRATIRADDRDLAFVSISLRDDEGVLDPTRDRRIRVRVEGPGTLQALGGARPDPLEGYVSGTHETHEGRLLAVVRPSGVGTISVIVEADDLNAVQVDIVAVGDPYDEESDEK